MARKFVDSGLQIQRLGQARIELSAGASGSFDTLTIGGVDVLGGAVNFDTSLAKTAKLVADAINSGTNTHGYMACAGIPDTNSEIVIYQTIPGALGNATVSFGVTTITADFVYPAAETDNEMWGATDSWVALEDVSLANDDLGYRGILRIDPDSIYKPETLIAKGGSPAWIQQSVNVSGVEHYKITNTEQASSVLKPDRFTIFNSNAEHLPISGWGKGSAHGGRWVVGVDLDDVFTPKYLLAV